MIPYKVIDTIAFGPFQVYTWGLLVGIAFLGGWLVALYHGKREKISGDQITTLSLWIILGAILGARLFFVVENRELYAQDFWSVFKLWQGGMSFYGGLGGASGAALLYIKKARLKLHQILDILALSLPLGLAIGRLGCFLINDHLGEITTWPWGISHPDGTLRHPVALYLSLSGLLCFIFLSILKKYILKGGVLTASMILWYSISRYFLDFTRAHDEGLPFADKHYLGLTLAQYISIILFFLGLYLLYYFRKQSY